MGLAQPVYIIMGYRDLAGWAGLIKTSPYPSVHSVVICLWSVYSRVNFDETMALVFIFRSKTNLYS